MSGFPLGSGIPAEDFLCVPEPDEDERLSSGLDGDETSHKQVSVEGPCASIHRVVLRLRVCVCVCVCALALKRECKKEVKTKAMGTER